MRGDVTGVQGDVTFGGGNVTDIGSEGDVSPDPHMQGDAYEMTGVQGDVTSGGGDVTDFESRHVTSTEANVLRNMQARGTSAGGDVTGMYTHTPMRPGGGDVTPAGGDVTGGDVTGGDVTGIDAGLLESSLEYIFLDGGRQRKRHGSWR
jgi:hypothetical protein